MDIRLQVVLSEHGLASAGFQGASRPLALDWSLTDLYFILKLLELSTCFHLLCRLQRVIEEIVSLWSREPVHYPHILRYSIALLLWRILTVQPIITTHEPAQSTDTGGS